MQAPHQKKKKPKPNPNTSVAKPAYSSTLSTRPSLRAEIAGPRTRLMAENGTRPASTSSDARRGQPRTECTQRCLHTRCLLSTRMSHAPLTCDASARLNTWKEREARLQPGRAAGRGATPALPGSRQARQKNTRLSQRRASRHLYLNARRPGRGRVAEGGGHGDRAARQPRRRAPSTERGAARRRRRRVGAEEPAPRGRGALRAEGRRPLRSSLGFYYSDRERGAL